jgi:hypothetical protein
MLINEIITGNIEKILRYFLQFVTQTLPNIHYSLIYFSFRFVDHS